MKVTVLGGADIGASCLWIQAQHTGWLVDAGTRMNPSDALPSLHILEEEKAKIEAIFITHAHQDHIGALPLLSAMFPDAPVYMTRPTLDISRVMLADALKLGRMEGHTPVFNEMQLETLWMRVRVMGGDVQFGWNGVRVSTYRAGHILGAVALGFETETEGSVLVTGDYSVTPTRLLDGLRIPKGSHYDVVISESTYGNRLHENRSEQERKLAEQVASVIKAGGSVLIPAFAVGRAQEVLMILLDAMRYNREIDPFPIVVDGLVRSVCPIYEAHENWLRGPARRALRTKGRLFAPEDIQFVRKAEEREQVVQGKPACIISSSGMLNGGPSVYYADALVRKETHAVFLCGYQDEESPGRLLLDLARGAPGERRWILPDRVVPVRSRVELYSLSAHADRRELAQIISEVRPRKVLLVHGDGEAKDRLASEIRQHLPWSEIMAVTVGQSVEWKTDRPPMRFRPEDISEEEHPVRANQWMGQMVLYRTHAAVMDHGGDEPNVDLQLGLCEQIDARFCRTRSMDGSVLNIPVQFVIDTFGRIPAGESAESAMTGLWQAALACIDEGRLWGYRPAERLGYHLAVAQGRLAPVDPYGEDELIANLSPYGWRKTDVDNEHKVIRLVVSFPWAVPQSLLQEISEKRHQAGWRYEMAPNVYPPAVNALARQVGEQVGLILASTPKIYPHERRVEVVFRGVAPELKRQELEAELARKLGGDVVVRLLSDSSVGSGTVTAARMEQNQVIGHLRQRCPKEWELQKVGLDILNGAVTLSVAFPDAVLRKPEAAEFAQRMTAETGWKVNWNETTNQTRLVEEAVRKLLQVGLQTAGRPSLHQAQRRVDVQIQLPNSELTVDQTVFLDVQTLFQDLTGWSLNVVGSGAAPVQVKTKASPSPTMPKMNSNQALDYLRQQVRVSNLAVYRVSVKGNSIELMFLTPEVGRRHVNWLARMSEEIGWPVFVADKVQQQELLDLARRLTDAYGLLRSPSLHLLEREVRVKTRSVLAAQVCAEFANLSGWTLVGNFN